MTKNYKVEGMNGTFHISPEQEYSFLQQYPNAVLQSGELEMNQSQDNQQQAKQKKSIFKEGSFLDNWAKGFSEEETPDIPEDGGFFEDLITSIKQGLGSGGSTGEAFDVYRQGANISDDQLNDYIAAANKMNEAEATQEQILYEKVKNEAGGGIFGMLKGLAYNPGFAPQALLTSIVTMVSSFFDSKEVMAATSGGALASGVTHAALGAGLTSVAGSIGGPIGAGLGGLAGGIGGFGIGAVKGAVGGLVGAMETGLTLTDLIKMELERKELDPLEDFTAENVRDILEDKNAVGRIRSGSLARGIQIGAIEGLTLGLSRGVTRMVSGTLSKKALAAGTTEMLGGSVGEYRGQKAVQRVYPEKEIDMAEVGLEGMLEIKGTVNSADLLAKARGRKYYLNDGETTRSKIESIINDPNTTPADLAKMKIEVENDSQFESLVLSKQNDAISEVNIDSGIFGKEDRVKLVDLNKQKIKAEKDVKKKGIFTVPNAKKKLADINDQINEIITPYEAADTATSDVAAQQQETIEVNKTSSERIFKANLQFAKKHSSMYNLKYTEMTYDEVLAEFGEDTAKNSSGFVDSKTGRLIINLDVAKSVGDITVGNHELLHGILRKALKDGDINIKLIDQLRLKLKDQFKKIEEVIKDEYASLSGQVTREQAERYGLDVDKLQFNDKGLATKYKDGTDVSYMDANPDEYLTILSDLIYNEKVTIDQSTLQSLMQPITDLIRSISPFSKVRFSDADAVLDFLREYNKSIHKGTLSGRIQRGTGADTSVQPDDTGTKFKRSSKKPVDNLAINSNTNKRYTKEEWDSVGASKAITEIKKQNLLDALIASKYKVRPVPDKFVDDVLGSSFFINHVNSFNPEVNDSLFGWVNSQIRNKAGSVFNQNEKGKLPKGTKTVEADARTTEGQPVVQMEDTDTSFERIDNEEINLRDDKVQASKLEVRERKSKFRNEIGITRKGKIFREVKKALRTAESIVNPKKFLKTFEKTVSDALFDFMKVYFPDTNSMIKYRAAILESIPVTTLVQMQKQLTEKIFVKSYGRLTNKTQISDFVYGRNESGKNPDKKKLLTEDILDDTDISKSRRKAGVQVYERLKPTSTQWQNYLNATEKGKRQTAEKSGTKGNNRIKILEESAKAIGRDATPENLTTEFLEDYIQEKGLQDVLTVDQVREEMLKSIDRPIDLKFKRISKAQAEVDGPQMGDATKKSMSSFGKQVVEKKKITRKSKKTGKEKSESVTDFDAIMSDGKTLREKTIEVFDRLKTTMPNRIKELRVLSTKSMRNFIGNTKIFDSLVEFNESLQELMGRFPYSKQGARTLNTNRVKTNKKGEPIFNIGTEVRNQKWVTAKEFFKDQSGKVENLIKFLYQIKDHLVQHPQDRWFFVQMFMDSQNNMDAITRIAAPLLGLPIDNNGNIIFNQLIEEEHMFVQSDIGKLFFWGVDNGKIDNVAEVLRSSYAQIALLQSDNTKIKQAKLSASMGEIFYKEIIPRLLSGELKVTKGLLSIARYALSGIDLNKIKLIDKNQTITQHFGIDVKNYNKLSEAQQAKTIEAQNEGLIEYFRGKTTIDKVKANVDAVSQIKYKRTSPQIKANNNIQKAIDNNLKYKRTEKARGMSTFDFDETLIIDGENFVIATDPTTGQETKISSAEWPVKGPELAAMGYQMNFDDFVNVRGGIDGPLLQKMKNQIEKYGPENVFILTARPQEADVAIDGWLKSKGINIPFKNITGLADSKGEAKAQWMLEKFAEGYNDMYFVDDALQNVKAVKNVLEQLDIKSKVVQAKLKFKRTASKEFNKIIEESQGTKADRIISGPEAKKLGRNKGWWRMFVPPSAEDFKGLMYRFLGRGRVGDKHMAWFKEKLFDPFAKGIREWNKYKQNMSEDFKNLQKNMKDVVKKINNKVPGTELTVDSAIRVYLWDKAGFDIPGMIPELQEKLLNYINNNPDVKAFADALSVISRTKEGYVKPSENWSIQTVASDLNNIVNKVGRKQFLSEFLENAKDIFTTDNMNKIEALYGTGFRDALENSLYRMENGSNRLVSNDKIVNGFYEWINASIGAIMFINSRSALLQTISTVNFVNMSDNNVFKASKAFANQPQYWKDFAMLFNSPQLKQRRRGLRTDVSASELTKTFSEGGVTTIDKAYSVFKYILEKGFTPTQMADSFAIAFGGATFYRNRLNTYLKQGMSEAKAKEQAMLDFQEIAEETQQSSREDLVSQQQAGILGRFILAFQNVTMQYTRFTKKRISDLANRRRTPGYTQIQSDMANISAILYYGAVQNLVFGALQSGLMFFLFGLRDDDDQEEKKTIRVINGALDSILRGTGVYGAILSTVKNTVMRWKEEKEKGWNKDFGNVLVEATNLSPPIGSKLRKIYSAMKTEDWNPGLSEEIGFRLENPNLVALSLTVEGATGLPIARVVNKANNVEEAITGNHSMWQRIFMALGWNRWDVGVKDEELEAAKDKLKRKKEIEKKRKKAKTKDKKVRRVRCRKRKDDGNRCKNMTDHKSQYCYAHR